LALDSVAASKATPYVDKGEGFEVIPVLSAERKFAGGGLIASSRQLADAGSLLTQGHLGTSVQLQHNLMAAKHEKGNYSYGMGAGVSTQGEHVGTLHVNMGGGSPGGRGYLLVFVEPGVSVGIAGNAEGEGDQVAAIAIALAKWFAWGES